MDRIAEPRLAAHVFASRFAAKGDKKKAQRRHKCGTSALSGPATLPRMEKELRFFPTGEPGLWGHEVYDDIEIEDGKRIICGVQFTKKPAPESDTRTADPELWEILREDLKDLPMSESVEGEWPEAQEGPVSRLGSRTRDALRSLHYVRVAHEDGPEHWRRALDLL